MAELRIVSTVQFSDFVDPRPTTEDAPPSIESITSDDYAEYVEVTLTDQSRAAVVGNPKYDPVSPLDEPFYDSNKATTSQISENRYRIEFGTYGVLNTPPTAYWLNATDDYGNKRVVKVDVEEGGSAKLAAAGVTAGAVVATPSPDPFPDELVRTPVGLAVLTVSAGTLVASYELAEAGGTTTRTELLTATAATYEETVVGDVTLPVGYSTTASSELVDVAVFWGTYALMIRFKGVGLRSSWLTRQLVSPRDGRDCNSKRSPATHGSAVHSCSGGVAQY